MITLAYCCEGINEVISAAAKLSELQLHQRVMIVSSKIYSIFKVSIAIEYIPLCCSVRFTTDKSGVPMKNLT